MRCFCCQGSLSAGKNFPLPPQHGDLASKRQLDKLYIVIKEVVIKFIEAKSLKDRFLGRCAQILGPITCTLDEKCKTAYEVDGGGC
jgi:hypothetical protein